MSTNCQAKLEKILGCPAPWIMGVLNTGPDSFSDGGRYESNKAASSQAKEMLAKGANIIDIGGEASGPGTVPVAVEQELARVLPVVHQLSGTAFISVDTYKAKTASEVLSAGAKMINDISALRADAALADVIKEHQAYLVLMHSKEEDSHPHVSETTREYTNLVQEIADFLLSRVEFALAKGIKENQLILDPGMGLFISQNPEYSWQLIAELDKLAERLSPFPLLIGTSRKSFLGGELDNRDPLSQLTSLIAVQKGASLIRTHNPRMAQDFIKAWQRCF